MTNKEFMLKLTALLDKLKSKKQINADIKTLEQSINRIKLIGTFSKAATKRELNAYIKQLEGQLAVVKLQAKLDENRLKREINSALKNVKISDIPVNEYGMSTKLRKIYVDFKRQVERNPISINFDTKKQTLQNQLTSYLAKNSKINESSILLAEADKLRDMFDNIDSRDSLKNATEQMKLFKTECSATGYATKGTTEKIGDLVKGITKVGSAFGVANLAITEYRKSLNTLKSNDTIMTEISKTSSMLKSEIEALGDSSFKIASQYGQLSSDYLLGVQEMSRSGYEDLSKELGRLSVLAQSAGNMTAENANNYLLATDAAYKYKGSIEKLTQALDGANYISNRNSASLTDIADSISVSASFASNAGVEIDELTAAEATMIATTKRSGSEMGRAFRSIILNLQQVAGEFDGEVIDEEQLKKVEARCHSLGVELEYMKDGVATLRDPMQILKELAEVYNSLPDNSADKQGLISDLGGKYHSNALSSLLSRWDLYEKMLEEYSQGTNSALAEAKKTADSWEGRLNSLQNSWDSFVNSLTNKNVIKGGISFFDSTIQSAEKLIDVIGEIPLVLTTINTALTAMNKNAGITQLINPDTNKLDIQGNFMGIDFTAIKEQKAHFEAAEGAITSWNKELLKGSVDLNDFGEEVVKNNAQLKAYLSTCSQEAPASLNGYKAYLNAAGVSTDALRLKTILLNSALSFGIGILVQLVATGVTKLIQAQDELAHKSEYCKERVDSLMSSYKSALDTANSHKDSIESLAERYEDLSKGVNNLGENISLTMDEYQEYNSIVNDIADMFPTMIQGYTDEGNAILKLKGNVDALREAYEAETKAAYNSLISSGEDSDGNDILKDSYNTIIKSEFGKHSWGNAGKIKYLDKVIEAANSVDDLDALWDESRNSGYMKWFEEYVTGSGSTGIKKLTPEQLAEIKQNAKILKQEYQAEINSVVDNVETLANAYLMTHEDYDKLEEDAKTAASIMVNSLNESIVAGFGEDKANVGKYVDDIVQTILENPDAQKSMVDLFTMDTSNMSVDEMESKIDSCIKDIAKYIHEDADELKIRLGFDDSETEPLKTKVQGFLQDAYKDNVGELTLEDLDIASKLEIPEGALLSWDELIARIEESKETLASDTSFSSIFNSSDFSDTKQSLIDLAKAGELTNKALSSDDYSDFIDKLGEIGISAEEAKTEILSLLDATEKLSGASKSISGLADAYNEFKEKGYVLAETIEAIPDVFRELETYDFDVFENIIGNPKNIEEMQGAFDDLVTAYINEQGTLLDVSEEETARFISNLKEMGVVNAEEVVNATVALNDSMKATAKEAESTAQEINEFLVNVKGKAASATNDLTNCTWSEIQALIEEGNKFGYTTSKIEEFAMQKIWANRNSINTSDDIAQLLAVAKAAGFAATSISAYENAVKMQNQGYGGGEAWVKSMQESAWRDVLREIEESFNFTPTVSYKAPTTNSSSSSSSSSSKEAEKTAEEIDWIEKLLERIQSRIDSLDKTASSTYRAWSERNSALLKELTEVNGEIKAQQKAYDVYMAKANSVGLSEHYKQLVQNGDYSIEDITDDTLKDQISSYEEWYNKATDCSDAITDLKDRISELGMTQFENLVTQYEDKLGSYAHEVEMLQTYIDQTEAKGYDVSADYYKKLISVQESNIEGLKKEYESLKESLHSSVDTGKIVAYSESWYGMVDNIRNVQKSLEDANSSLIEYQNSLRELEWNKFDKLADKISKISEESDFLISLMSDEKMFTDEGITDEGQATLGLHAINYNTYLTKADEYAREIQKINGELADDPSNNTLLERRQELLDLQRESILASEDEKQAMLELKKEGYDVFLESLQKIIDRRRDMMQDIKDMHDFEKSISKQTSEVARLEKILKAYERDNSEETRAKIQEYKVSLEEAKENLEETEYDKYIQDQEQMLDDLYSQAEEWINQRLDNLSQLVSDVIDSTNENASEINETIKESADNVGYTISSKLANAFNSASNGVSDLVSDYNDNFLETMTTLQASVDAIRGLIAGTSDTTAGDKIASVEKSEKDIATTKGTWTKNDSGNWNYYKDGEQVKDSWTKYDKDNKWYHLDSEGNMSTSKWIKNDSGTWSYVNDLGQALTGWHKLDWQGSMDWYNFDDEGNMLENQWIDDYFVAKSGKMLTNTWIGHNGKYYWVGADGKWLDKPGWSLDYKPNDGLPIYEYAKGSKRIPKDQLALMGEKGQEVQLDSSEGVLKVVGKGDMVFTNEASQKLWEFSQDPEGYMAKLGLSGLKPVEFAIPSTLSMTKMPEIQRVAPKVDVGGVVLNVELPNVNNPQEFAKQLRSTLATDTKTQKLLTEKIGSSFLGRTDRSSFYR